MARAPRSPIVAVMGHIDHGKSSLLDYIRKTNVVASEAGGITQHVSAYVALHEHEGAPRRITFLDTPGHEAFQSLRVRGAVVADVVILVVAADEGVKPQTLDALSAINDAGVSMVVALTKTDKPGADVERAKNSLLEHGVYLEGLGGSIPFAAVSSKTGEGVPELLDLVLLTADLAELTADADAPASGFVLESSQDPKRGLSATLIVKDGTLKTGTVVVADAAIAPVRFIEDFLGARIASAGPSEPATVSGFSELPPAGSLFAAYANRKEAEVRVRESKAGGASVLQASANDADASDAGVLPLVLKADVSGSIEAIKHELAKISHPRAHIRILSEGIGAVTEGDVKTAGTRGVIVAFNAKPDATARDLAERSGTPIESFAIIYDLGKRVEELLKERAPHVTEEVESGSAKVLKIFNGNAQKQVFGARLVSGAFAQGAQVKFIRNESEIGRGKISNLQQARADVKEIRTEGEFGIEVETRAAPAPGDAVVAFRRVES
ncbi:MAG: translation initiation factor IF-2 [Patescibacteria group bacterium]|nr:translation initiation factor IF-2 [Patescibacteria group bacterium]MDE1965638.1 translation initiation factor IF-2 [Patescibacteria group bacterium]